MQSQIETIGMLLIKGVVLPVVGLFVAYASAMLPQWIKAKVKNETVGGVLERLTALAFTVVSEVQQTIVSGLGDKATEAELLKARDTALATLRAHLGDKGIKELMGVLGMKEDSALNKLLITFIESAVHNLKASKPPTIEATAIASPVTAAATVTEEPKS